LSELSLRTNPLGPPLRVVFAGTPEFARAALEAIVAAGFTVVGVLTQPDRPAGRGLRAQPSPVKAWALAHGLGVDQPQSLRTEAAQAPIAALAPDVIVVAAYGLMLPQAVLDLPRWGCLNIHASLLPRWRGAAPIHRAIEAGDLQSGITVMRMDAGLDTGPIVAVYPEPIAPTDTTGTLHDRLARLGASAIVTALNRLQAAERLGGDSQPQEGVTYADKIRREEAQIDWREPADVIARRVRAFDPFPVASFQRGGEQLKVWRAHGDVRGNFAAPGTVLRAGPDGLEIACGSGRLSVFELQRAGGRRLPVDRFLQGYPMTIGTVLDLSARLA
jgi:methionyl-tRNA formyltransferase